jgi:hypothetical protein
MHEIEPGIRKKDLNNPLYIEIKDALNLNN